MSAWIYLAIAVGLFALMLYGAAAAAQHAAEQAIKKERYLQLLSINPTPVAYRIETLHPVKLGASETVPASLWYNNPGFQNQVVNHLADKMMVEIVPAMTVRNSPDWQRDSVRIEATLYVCRKENP